MKVRHKSQHDARCKKLVKGFMEWGIYVSAPSIELATSETETDTVHANSCNSRFLEIVLYHILV
jgi:hypothetical protein